MRKSTAPALIACLLATGCADLEAIGPKQGIGTLGGAAAGGLAGSQIGKGSGKLATTALGTLLGAFLGSEVGRSLDRSDETHRQRALEQAFGSRIGQPVVWESPETGNHGVITPTHQYRERGARCREFTQTVWIGGRKEEAVGHACRQADGTWRIVS